MEGMAYLAAAYAAGVYISPKISVYFTVLFAVIYLIIRLIRRAGGSRPGALSTAVVLTFCAGAVMAQYYGSPSRREVSRYEGMYVTLTGRICEIPDTEYENNRYIVDVRRVSADGKSENLRERMLITAPESFEFGDTVEFSGFVRELDDRLNKNGFDSKLYYKSKDIFYRCFSRGSAVSDVKIKSRTVYSYAQMLKNSISQILDKYTHGDKGAILTAVIVGEGACFSEDFEAVLNRTGIARFFYPAFLHIMLIVGLIGLFSGIVRRGYRDIALAVLLMLYAMAQSSRPVFVKACLVAVFLIIFRRRLGYIWFPDVLGAAVIAIGAANPLLFHNAGFVSSVTASLLISLFYEPVTEKIKNGNRYYKRTLAIGFICTIGLLPLSALYFNGITIYNIAAGLIFLPVTAIILVLAPLLLSMLALFGCAPVVGEIMTSMAWIYEKLPYLIDKLPYDYIALPKVGALTIIAFYTAVFGVYMIYRERRYKGLLALCAAAAFFAVVLAGEAPRLSQADFTFVNVGQGDGALVRLPYRTTVLIDGGGGNEYTDYNQGEREYLPYLKSLGLAEIDCAVVSHCHSDHAEGIIAAIKNIRVRHVYLPETDIDNQVYRELMLTARKYGTEIHIVTEPTKLSFKSGLGIIMYPPGENALLSGDENDKSLLVRASYGETDCYFTGDMPKAEEFGLVASGCVSPAEILKVAHHGSDSSTSKMFLDAVKPDTAVISVGMDNGYGLPSEAVLGRLSEAEVYRTDKNGDIVITADKNGKRKVKTFK